ncbi:uncharacterized protein [Arachis hypogaea]|uniref:uncharacterized protein n=1 Tax=Arachis hypogaea TaxID=3818 RepID=UPI003B20E46F
MKEVVQKEAMKLWEAGIIYPISDSPWVSPVQVVPKKRGVTVIANEKNELILTRIVTSWRMCIVLGHRISSKGIEVDKAKVEIIEKLPPPANVKAIRVKKETLICGFLKA